MANMWLSGYVPGSVNSSSPRCSLWIELAGMSGTYIVMASSTQIVLLEAETQTVVATGKGHTGRVNSLAVAKAEGMAATCLVSGGCDGSVKIWCVETMSTPPGAHISLREVATLESKSPKGSVLSVTALAISPEQLLVSASYSDGGLSTWCGMNEGTDWRLSTEQTQPPTLMIHDLHARLLHNRRGSLLGVLILAAAVDSRIHLMLSPPSAWAMDDGALLSLGALAGHDDWVTHMDSVTVRDGDDGGHRLMIASASQDGKIRLWCISSIDENSGKDEDPATAPVIDDDDEDEEDAPPRPIADDEEGASEARLTFTAGQGSDRGAFEVTLDALCVGHEDFVTAVYWIHEKDSQNLQLFSTSMDRNMMIWRQDDDMNVWAPVVRIGDVGGTLGGTVGGNLLGFVGGCVAPNGCALIGVAYGGSVHLWHEESSLSTTYCGPRQTTDHLSAKWSPRPFPSGHFGPVTSCSWSRDGHYLATGSSDETVRLWAPVAPRKSGTLQLPTSSLWREVARPAIHGYDVTGVALCPLPESQLCYVGSSEKVVRILDASREVLQGLKALCGVTVSDTTLTNSSLSLLRAQIEQDRGLEPRVNRAFSPELALTNKATDLMSAEEREEIDGRGVPSLAWQVPPLQGQLADHTVFPEAGTLYGHTNDVTALTLSDDGQWLATACKARDAGAAAVLVWNTQHLESSTSAPPAVRLQGHESTVVAIAFDHTSRWLATAGKDRALCLHRRVDQASMEGRAPFEGWVQVRGAHKRIIWCAAWVKGGPAENDRLSRRLLVTGSRDGFVKVWSGVEGPSSLFCCVHEWRPLEGEAITAIAALATPATGCGGLVSVGGESGMLQVWWVSSDQSQAGAGDGTAVEMSAVLEATAPVETCHAAAVRALSWRPDPYMDHGGRSDHNDAVWHIASVADDQAVSIFALPR